MLRPARVRMRKRKPWVFARLRLFGWKVRFVMFLPMFVNGSALRGAQAHVQTPESVDRLRRKGQWGKNPSQRARNTGHSILRSGHVPGQF